MAVPDGVAGGSRSHADVDCEDAVRQLYTYLDGELTDERRHAIAGHLDDCGSCAGAAEFEAELRHIIASHCKDRVPQSLIDRIGRLLAEEGGGPEADDPTEHRQAGAER
jgi:mycothiol system anti-sigma-R factor